MSVRIQFRRDTEENWSDNDPTLAEGEMGLEKDTGRWKIGNGSDSWNVLPYSNSIFSGPSTITDSSAGNALKIIQTGSGNALLVEDSSTPDSTPFVINNAGKVGIGKASPSVLLDVDGDASFSGTVSAPTASANTNTTQLATTAYVVGQASSTNPLMNGTVGIGTSLKYSREDHVHASDTSRAPVASPTFTGVPAAPTAAVDTNTTQVATTAYVVAQGYLKSATAASTYLTPAEASSLYISSSNASLTGVPTAPTAAADTDTTQIATTAFVVGQASSSTPQMNGTAATGTSLKYARADHVHASDTTKANLASPTFTGTPAGPTASFATSTTQLATTAFVQRAISQVTVTNVSGSTISPSLSDAGSIIATTGSSLIVCTLPADSTVAFPVGSQITFIQRGTGQLVFAIDVAGSAIEATPGAKLRTRYSVVTATKINSNIWSLYGDLTA